MFSPAEPEAMMPDDMKFGLFTAHDRTLSEARAVWVRAEELGFDAVGIVDSPLLMREALVSMAAAAMDTQRITIFPCVMNTITRDVSVVAGAYLGLRDLAGDRVLLCLGAGDSSTFGIGLGTATRDELANYVTALRQLLAGEEAVVDGRRMRGHWHGWNGVRPRIFMSAHGPRALANAGRVADGVVSGFGLSPEQVARAESLVRDAAAAAGRDPEAIEIWHRAYYCPAETVEDGFVYANGAGAAVLARGGFAGKLVPPKLIDGIREVADTWSLKTHGGRANPDALEAAKRTGTLDYLVERGGGMIGPVDVAETLLKLRERGVRNVLFTALGEDKLQLVNSLGSALGPFIHARAARGSAGVGE